MNSGDILYLSSLDSVRFASVRECVLIRQLALDTGKQCALMSINPPVLGQEFNRVSDIDRVLLVNRHEGATLFPINEFPCFVFICRPLIEGVDARETVTKSEIEIIGWGELYRSRGDAANHTFD
jgi:hypothetical protein